MTDHLDYMRSFILLAENLQEDNNAETILVESEKSDHQTTIALSDLVNLSDKMRSVMETATGDYANGFDDGMQRAAEMLENLIRRHREGKEHLG